MGVPRVFDKLLKGISDGSNGSKEGGLTDQLKVITCQENQMGLCRLG